MRKRVCVCVCEIKAQRNDFLGLQLKSRGVKIQVFIVELGRWEITIEGFTTKMRSFMAYNEFILFLLW